MWIGQAMEWGRERGTLVYKRLFSKLKKIIYTPHLNFRLEKRGMGSKATAD